MPTAREKLEEVLRGMRFRDEQQASALSLWRKALPRCRQLAEALAELVRSHGITVKVGVIEDSLWLSFADRENPQTYGATAEFRFDAATRSVCGWRTPFCLADKGKVRTSFFSLNVPVGALTQQASSPFGPQGPAPLNLGPGTQEAFEKAVVDFLEWALVRDGAGDALARQR